MAHIKGCMCAIQEDVCVDPGESACRSRRVCVDPGERVCMWIQNNIYGSRIVCMDPDLCGEWVGARIQEDVRIRKGVYVDP